MTSRKQSLVITPRATADEVRFFSHCSILFNFTCSLKLFAQKEAKESSPVNSKTLSIPDAVSYGGRGPLSYGLWHVYILKCADDTFYVGKTKNLDDRLMRHSMRQVSYTSSRLPVELITWITFTVEWKAVLMEKYLKSGSGRAFMKRHLI